MLSKRKNIIEVVNLPLECCPVKETIVVIKKRDKLHYNLPRPTTSSGWKLLRPIPSKHETLNQWAHRLQLWPNINTALVQRLVSAEYISIFELTIPFSGVAWRRAGLPSVTPCDHSAQPHRVGPTPVPTGACGRVVAVTDPQPPGAGVRGGHSGGYPG